MKNFFTILDKNFKNLIIMFLAILVMGLAIYDYKVSFIDIIIYDLAFIWYLKCSDKLFASFKKGN